MGKKKFKSKRKNAKKASDKTPKHCITTATPPPPPTSWVNLNDDCWKGIIAHLFPIDCLRLAYTSKRFSTVYNAHGPCVPIGKSLGRLAAAKSLDKKEVSMLRAHNAALEEWAEAFVDEAALFFEGGYYYDYTADDLVDSISGILLPSIPGIRLKSIHVKTEGSNALPWTSLEELLDGEERINFHSDLDEPWVLDEFLMEFGYLMLIEATIQFEFEVEVYKYGYKSVVTEMNVSIQEFDRNFLDSEDEDMDMDSYSDMPPIVKGDVLNIGHTYKMDHVTVTVNDGEPSRIAFHLPTEDDESGGIMTAPWLVQSVRDVLTVLLTHKEGVVDYNTLPYWYLRALRRCCDRWRLKKCKKLFCS